MKDQWFLNYIPGIFVPVGDIWVGRATYSPKLAQEILAKRNNLNRSPIASNIEFLARTMTQGEFLFTGETIIFDRAGNLLNGQNRLHAVIKSGCSVEILSVFGIDTAVFPVLDQGAVRTLSHVLGIHGEANASKLAGALSALNSFFQTGIIYGSATCRATRSDMLFLLEQHPTLRESVATVLGKPGTRLIGSPSTLAAMHRVFCLADKGLGQEFVEAFVNLASNNSVRHSSVRLLLKRLVESSGHGVENSTTRAKEKITPIYLSKLYVKAWNHFYAGTQLKNLRVSEDEGYPKVAGWEYDGTIPKAPIQTKE